MTDDSKATEYVEIQVSSECPSYVKGARWTGGDAYYVTGTILVPADLIDQIDEEVLMEWANDEEYGIRWKDEE